MRIAHLSDFHFTHLTFNPFRLFSKRCLGNLNWLLSRKDEFFEEQLQPLPELFKKLQVDLILLGGDFATTALKEEFEKAEQFIAKMHAPWIAIPGNHDCYTKSSFRQKRFYRYFSNPKKKIQDPVDFFTLQDHRLEVHRLFKGWRLIALDTAIPTNFYSSEGFFSERLEELLLEALQLIPEEESIVLFNHYPFFQNDVQQHNLRRGENLQKILENVPRIRLYLHGHTHRHTIADLQESRLPILLDSGSCAQGKKGSWNLIDLEEKGCAISTYRWNSSWAKIRTEEFLWRR